MTNSHNRTNSHQAETSGGQSSATSNTSGRFFANNSNAGKYAKANGGSAKKQQQQQQSLNTSLNSSGRGQYFGQNQQQPQDGQKYFNDSSSNNDKFFVPLKGATSTPGKSRSSPQHRNSPTGTHGAAVLSQLSSSPPNLSHFAGSKCYDAPAPTALPKPPSHWTGGQDVVMTMPPVPVQVPVVPVPPKQKQQAYYQKNGKGAGKANAGKKHVHHHHRPNQHQAHHNPMVSCSREYLMAAAANTASGDYDKFSENLKMVLNVRA